MKSLFCLLSSVLSCLSLLADATSLARAELVEYLGDRASAVVTAVDSSMDAEAWSVRGTDGKVELRGGSERGLCYAVYEFLEREIGVRWLTPWGDEVVPVRREIPAHSFSYAGKPALDYRWFLDFGFDVGPTKGGRKYLFRQRHNLIDGEKTLPCKANVYPPMCHSIHHYIPPKTYFGDHPEYFSMDKAGKRVSDIQLCFSNPGLKVELKRVFYAHVEKCGGKGVFNLSALDHPGTFCYCPECVAAEKKYGTPGAPYFLYLRELAQSLAKDYPDAILDFLVYRVGQTEVPPNAAFGRFPDNCAAMFAPIDNDFSKSYSHKHNVEHLKNLKGWGAIVRQLWTWYYPLPYGEWAPFAGIRRTAADLRMAYEAGLTGGTFEHDVGTRLGAGFADLLTYLISRLYCDPKADVRPIAEEFCRLYYGAAAEEMLAYMDELDRLADEQPRSLPWTGSLDAVMKPEFLIRWNEKFDVIERKVAADDVLLQRVRECRLTLASATLRTFPKIRKAHPEAKLDPKTILDASLKTARAAADRRFTDAKVANQHYRKFADPAERAYRHATAVPKPLPACFASLPEGDVIEILAQPTCGARNVADPDAAIGLACEDTRQFEKPIGKYEIGFYDMEHKRHFPRRTITPAEVVPDAYHFYRVGRYELTRDCLVWLSWAWRLQFALGPYWMPGGEDKWDVYVSLKLEGPFFSDRSKAKTNRVLFDRAVLVRVPRDEAVQPKDLPVGEALPALPPDPFPDRMSAYVWRNWGLVGKTRLAETVGATSDDLARIATEMGLPADPAIEPEWATRGYITVIRRNWHLLDYNQLLKLTGMDVARMKSVLVDHDFLFQKLGRMKPLCRPLVYRAEEIDQTHGARMKIAEILAAEGVDAGAPQEPRFAFVKELTAIRSPQSPIPNPRPLRLMSSYFADFGDPLGDDEIGSYPEGLLVRLAAEGVNAIWLPVALKHLDARHYANARTLTARAAKRGLGVYVYLNEPRGTGAGMCTSLPETRRCLVEKTRELFAAVPDLRGALTITASENPTSCASQGQRECCPRCKGRSFAEIVSEVNACIAEGMRAANPKAELIVWDWGWDSCSGEDWRRLVPAVLAKLPKENVRFLTVSERFIPTNRGGFPAKVNEYSISTPGPGERARTCWEAAKANGLGLMAKVQASASWEFASVPYLPCMDLVAEHAWNLKRAGIDDIMLSWSVGAWPSPNLRLFGLARADDSAPDAALDRLAAELYGETHVASARVAWKAFSDGFREYPFWSCVLHRGPHHMGPANLLYPVATGCRTTMTGVPYDDLAGWCDIYPEETWIAQMAKVRDGFSAGNRLWAEHLKTLKGETHARALREARMFGAVELHFKSIVDQAEFVRARRSGDAAEMRRLAACELKTAKTMLKIVRSDSRIGYECANHYFYTQQDIMEKIVNCRQIIQSRGLSEAKPKDVPELMRTASGRKVTSAEDWERVRRPEILSCFAKRVFGRRPAEAERPDGISFETVRDDDYAEGNARRKVVRVHYAGPCGKGHFDLVAFIPKAEGRVPAFVLICNRGADNIDPDRKVRNGFWPVEEILARGYATVAFTTHSVAADRNVGFNQGVFPAYQREGARDAESWATISAWAWGASRTMDWIETVPEIDATHVAVVGHSRGGKTALWTGATDPRFALACSNDSGCSGAKLNHIELPESEHIVQIMKNFPYWFCGNYAQAIGREFELDFDQHELVALMAPRLVAIASATEDNWAGQPGEWWSGKLASPVWELYGKKGLVADVWPKPESPQQDGCVSYHLRTGEHTLAAYDWKCYMDFADRHGWRK